MNEPTKILHVTSDLSVAGAGLKAAVESLSASMKAVHGDVTVLGLDNSDWARTDHKTWMGAPARTVKPIGPNKLGYSPGMVSAIYDLCPNVVHVHGLWRYSCMAARSWSEKTTNPYVISPHGMLSPSALQFSRLYKRLAVSVCRRSLQGASCLVASSAGEMNDIRAWGLTNPVAVIPLGVHPIKALSTTKPGRRQIIYLGRLHPIKGIENLLEAWSKLEAAHSDWELLIVGPDENRYSETIARGIKELALSSVRLQKPVVGHERDLLLASAELCVLPSLGENFGLTIAESLMVGTPVIANKGAPWEGLIDHRCGVWIDHGVEALTVAMKQMLSLTDEERTVMGLRGREWMLQDFTWPSVARKHIKLYRWLGHQGEKPDFVNLK
jgi:glycosyltransferase involved in cell wall biosynthesis